MFEANDPMVQEYIIEAKEHLASFEDNLLLLNKDQSYELVNQLFRDIHTVKGGSGFFGFTRIGELAHSIETVMDQLRSETLKCSEDLVDLLLESNDLLKSLFDHVSGSNDVDISAFTKKLDSWGEETVVETDEGIDSFVKLYQDLVRQETEAGRFLYYISFDSSSDENAGRLELMFWAIYMKSQKNIKKQNIR